MLGRSDLYDYQEYAYGRVMNIENSALFLDLGLGKTVVALTAVNDLMLDSIEIRRTLVVAPLRVARKTWPDEVKNWEHLKHLKTSVIVGDVHKRTVAARAKAHIFFINYENLAWLVALWGSAWPYDFVIFDESTKMKNRDSTRHKAILLVRGYIKRVLLLTGTPVANGYIDLWGQIYLIDGGKRLYDTIGRYRLQYFHHPNQYKYLLRDGADDEIHTKIRDIAVSMRTEDYLKLPPIKHQIIRLDLGKEVLDRYIEFEKESILELYAEGKDPILPANEVALRQKLVQYANGQVYYEPKKPEYHIVHDEKLEKLADMIDEANGEPILVFYSYQSDCDRILKRFPEAQKFTKDSQQDAWNRGEIPILVAHPASAGHGLNMQFGGHIVIFYGLNYSLELVQQAIKRVHRNGQGKPCFVYYLLANETIDFDIWDVLTDKEKVAKGLSEATKARINRYLKNVA